MNGWGTKDIFHITAIPNLAGIVARGELLPKSAQDRAGVQHASIAYQNIQGRRAVKPVTCGPGGVIHDYVPFYFAPRSPMLMTIDSGNVPGCPYRQDDIVHLRTTIGSVVAAGIGFVFYDFNAATAYAQAYANLNDLSKIDWPLFYEAPRLDGYCKYWNSTSTPRYARRMETRMAEFLTYGPLPLAVIGEVVARTPAIAAAVEADLRTAGCNIPVRAEQAWYY